MSGTAPGMQNFVTIGLRISVLQIRDFAVPFDVTTLCSKNGHPFVFAITLLIVIIFK